MRRCPSCCLPVASTMTRWTPASPRSTPARRRARACGSPTTRRPGRAARAIIERWLQRTRCRRTTRAASACVGEVAHLDEVLGACGDADVVVLAADAQPAPGWLQQLARASPAMRRSPPPRRGATPAKPPSWPRDRRDRADARRSRTARARLRRDAADASGIARRRRPRRGVARLARASARVAWMPRAMARGMAALIDLSLRLWRPGLAQRVVRNRFRRARWRRRAVRRRHGCARRALARVARAPGAIPDGRSACATCARNSRAKLATVGPPAPQRELFA